MSYYDDLESPYENMDEEEYSYRQQQEMHEEWEWYEHEQSLMTDKPAPFDEDINDQYIDELYYSQEYSTNDEARKAFEDILEFIYIDLGDILNSQDMESED